MEPGHHVLIIEDDATLAQMLADQVARMGHVTRVAAGRRETLIALADFNPDLALLDLRLPDVDGQVFLPELREYCPVIVITAYGSIDQAVQTVRAGAGDYLVKPVSAQGLDLVLTRFFQTLELRRDLAFWQSQAGAAEAPRIVGAGEAIESLRRQVALYAPADTPVLIIGESGTGKEMAARAIHASSPRANGRFVSVDCDPGLEAAELFGSWQGGTRSEGLLAAAENGTLFLAGIERLDPDLHARLLRAMETGSYRAIGSSVNLPARARFVLSGAMSPTDLKEAARHSDLIQYLSAFAVEIPPLRERRADIAPLAWRFLDSRTFQRSTEKELTPEAIAVLEAYDWPGNVRELGNVIERAIIMSHGLARIGPEHLNLPVPASRPGQSDEVVLTFANPPTLDELRDEYFSLLLQRFHGNRRRVAEVSGISERNLYRLLRKDDDPAAAATEATG